MKRSSVKQSIKQQVSSNLADKPSLANGPPRYNMDALNASTHHLADEHTLANGPHRYSIDALNASKQHLADEHTLADGPCIIK